MFLAKVVGTVVATQKHQAFQGSKLLLLQPLVAQQRDAGAVGQLRRGDRRVGAGLGEFVMFTQGSSARLAAQHEGHPGRRDHRRHRRPRRSRRDEAREAVMLDRKQMVAEIADEVISRLLTHLDAPGDAGRATAPNAGAAGRAPAKKKPAPTGHGVFATVDEAVRGGGRGAGPRGGDGPRGTRPDDRRDPADLRRAGRASSARWSSTRPASAASSTRSGSCRRCSYVLGVEAMQSDARSDRTGLCVIERAPWGVIGMVLPATHSVPTMVSNAMNILAAGNTAVFSPHPAGARVAAYALQLFNRTIEAEIGVANVITTVAEPSIESAEQIFRHPDVALLCVTGGPAVVKAAAQSGKRVIAGGPGNPPVVVDEDADLDLAARSIIEGAAFDNNLLCIGEKEVFVVESVADDFIAAMSRAGAVQLDARAIKKLTEAAFTFDGPGKGCGRAHVKRDLLGQDAACWPRRPA